MTGMEKLESELADAMQAWHEAARLASLAGNEYDRAGERLAAARKALSEALQAAVEMGTTE